MPIVRYDRSSTTSLTNPSAYDNGQALQVSILDEQYTIIIGLLSLHVYKNSTTDELLQYVFSWPVPHSYQPTQLVKSVTNGENFFLVFQQHVPLEFSIDIDNDELQSMQPGIEEATDTVSTVLPSAADDIYALKVSGNQVRLFSVLEQEYKRTVTLAPYCQEITILYRLPAISQDRTVTFVVKCIGQVVQYHVVASYLTEDPIVVTSIELGFPVGSSTYLAVRNESIVTVYNLLHLTRGGVPQPRTFRQAIQKMVVFEKQNKTIFVVYRGGQNLTEVDAEDFFNLLPGAIKSIPGTLQDSTISPHMIVNDGLVVVAKNGQNFDMVALTLDSTTFTLTETARGVGTNQAPCFVTFVPDPDSPSIMTDEPAQTTQTTTDEPTQSSTATTDEVSTQPTTAIPDEVSTQPTTAIMDEPPLTDEVPTASTTASNPDLWIIAVVVLGLLVMVVGISVPIIILLLYYCLWKKRKREYVCPSTATENETPAPAPAHDPRYANPSEEIGDPGINNSVSTATVSIEATTILPPKDVLVGHGSAGNLLDRGYYSRLGTPLSLRSGLNNSQLSSRSDIFSSQGLDGSNLQDSGLQLQDTPI